MSTGRLSDVLRSSPAVDIVQQGSHSVVQIRRARNQRLLTPGYCPIQYYVDGIPVTNAEVDDFSPTEVETLEVYPSAASVPPEYAGARAGCGVVAIRRRTTAVPK